MKYSIAVLFNEDLNKLLMIRKKRSIYKGFLNFVGGKYEPDLDMGDMMACAEREVFEETGVDMYGNLRKLCVLSIPKRVNKGDKAKLYVYYGIITGKPRQTTDEELVWVDLNSLYKLKDELAGDGNSEYFINLALIQLRKV